MVFGVVTFWPRPGALRVIRGDPDRRHDPYEESDAVGVRFLRLPKGRVIHAVAFDSRGQWSDRTLCEYGARGFGPSWSGLQAHSKPTCAGCRRALSKASK